MKKLVSLLLTCALLTALCACGGGGGEQSQAPNPPSEPVSGGESQAPAEGGYNGESFTIAMSSTYTENDDQSATMIFFKNKVEELSGGKVNVTISWGGTEYDDAGIWDALSSGLLNMDFMLLNKHTRTAPLMAWGFMPYGENSQASLDQSNWLLFENETTSKIFSDYFSGFGMKILGNTCDGSPSFITTFPWDTLDELVSKCPSFGTMNTAKYQALGLSCTSVTGGQAYENLDRGIVDGVSSSLSGALSNSLYEVAGYACVDGQITAGVLVVSNEDWWNGLSAEAQALVTEAIDASEAFCAQHVDEATLEAAQTWEEHTGNAVKFLEGQDAVDFWVGTLTAIANNSKANASGQAYEEDMKTVLTEWIAYQADYHNVAIDWTW